ncbi:MAG TPA: hypothetical protein VGB30_05900 [bacterium]|jgi:hypothetical protein
MYTRIFPFADQMENVGAGFSWPAIEMIVLGWTVEAPVAGHSPVGFSGGSLDDFFFPGGYSLSGSNPLNNTVGWNVRQPVKMNIPVGGEFATPYDFTFGLGCWIGTVDLSKIPEGFTLMGLSRFPVDFIPLNDAVKTSLPVQIAVRKNKTVTLNGTDPEDLD